ncbi:MAG: hypothetical protein MJB14_20450 [Spirochaetes bacterium]|nr:hypothetical protein [Spirochaetota bacterium]
MQKSKLLYFFTLILLAVFSTVLFADDDYQDLFKDIPELTKDNTGDQEKINGNIKPDTFLSGLSVTFLGKHHFNFHIPVIKDEIDFDGYIKSPKLHNTLGVEVNFSKITLVSHWKLDLILNEWGDPEELLEADPLENYLSWSPWKFYFAVGFQEFNWGAADRINPVNNLNLKDSRHPYQIMNLPSLSLYTKFFPIKYLSAELVYIPFYLALENDPTDIVAEILNLDSKDITKDKTVNPGYFTLAGKLNLFFRFLDFSFSYCTQIDPQYSVEIKTKRIEENPLPWVSYHYDLPESAKLINRRLHHMGTDVKANIDIFTIWLELCFTLSEDYLLNDHSIRNHQLNWVVGMDFNYGPNSDFYFNIQYYGIYHLLFNKDYYNDYDPDNIKLDQSTNYHKEQYYRAVTDNMALVREGLVQGIALELKWPVLNDLLTPQIRIVYSLPLDYDTEQEIRYGSLYLRPELDIMPVDSFHIMVGADLFFSWYKPKDESVQINDDDFTGNQYPSSNIYLAVKYDWGITIKK